MLLIWLLQFFLQGDDIGKNRAEVSLSRISELNSYVNMSVHTEQLTEEFLGQFQVGVRQTVTIIPYWFIPNFQSLLTRTVLTPEIVRLALFFKVLLN